LPVYTFRTGNQTFDRRRRTRSYIYYCPAITRTTDNYYVIRESFDSVDGARITVVAADGNVRSRSPIAIHRTDYPETKRSRYDRRNPIRFHFPGDKLRARYVQRTPRRLTPARYGVYVSRGPEKKTGGVVSIADRPTSTDQRARRN